MLTRFCCCCDLRRGCIVFSWLQLMFISLAIAGMSVPLYIMAYNATPILQTGYGQQLYVRSNGDAYFGIYAGISMLIAEQAIKAITCISLILGLVKKLHMYYQAWLFVSGIENCLLSLSFLGCFFGGFALPTLFIPMIPIALFVGLGWYFWFSVFAVYQTDMKNNTIAFSANYEGISLIDGITAPNP